MTNHRLRGAMLNAELTPSALAALVGVDAKSVARWIAEDRVPYPVTRIRVANALHQHETFLWPSLLEGLDTCAVTAAEVERVWPTRSAVSTETWHALFSRAKAEIDILVYAGGFLIETLDLADVLRWKASKGTVVRVLVGDPDSAAVRLRAAELSMSWLPERCRTTAGYLGELKCLPGVILKPHATTLYASQFRFDDVLLVNTHAFGIWACHSPVFQLRRALSGRLFDFYLDAFDRTWRTAVS